tara:strand:+ start:96 stop:314 length:219 start_codon:yes stop_codon:yes gene_type:complete
MMIFIKSYKNQKTNIIENLLNNNTVNDLLNELFIKNGYQGKLILCGKIISPNLRIKNLKNIYKYWNGKIIYF